MKSAAVVQPSPIPGILPPIWYPPIEVRWIFVVVIVFFAAVSNRIPLYIIRIFTSPVGFFITSLVALASYQLDFPPGSFAILFFLLLAWSSEKSKQIEGFLNGSNTVDWVTNSKRWYVEKVLKERPLGIQETNVQTYPIQGSSNQASNTTTNT